MTKIVQRVKQVIFRFLMKPKTINDWTLQKRQEIATYVIIISVVLGLAGTYYFLNKNIRPSAGTKVYYSTDTSSRLHSVDSSTVQLFIRDSTIADKGTNGFRKADPSNAPVSLTLQRFVYNSNPTLMIWVYTMSIMVAIGIGLALSSGHIILKLKAAFSLVNLDIIINSIIAIGIGILTVFLTRSEIGNWYSLFNLIKEFKILVTETKILDRTIDFTTALACIPLCGILMINSCIASNHWSCKWEDHKERIKIAHKFQHLKESMNFFLTSISIIIVFSIVVTTLLQKCVTNILVVNAQKFVLFPDEIVYSYGLIFTFLLAILYIPVYQNLKIKGQALQKEMTGAGVADTDLKEDLTSLDLKGGPLKNLQAILSILAPVLGSVFMEFMKVIP